MEGHSLDDYDKAHPPPPAHQLPQQPPPGHVKAELGDWLHMAAGGFRTQFPPQQPQRYLYPGVAQYQPPYQQLYPYEYPQYPALQYLTPVQYRFPPVPQLLPLQPMAPPPLFEMPVPPQFPLQPAPDFTHRRKRLRKHDSILLLEDGDNELKQLAELAAADTPLHELAAKIKLLDTEDLKLIGTLATGLPGGDARGKETKERQRQIFGMVWLLKLCEALATAVVPRNRIYARYVRVCADHNLPPLLPALFGKLVRILFPNLTTRRLGMRGQSKYHYCGIKLNGDQGAALLRGHHRQLLLYGLLLGITQLPTLLAHLLLGLVDEALDGDPRALALVAALPRGALPLNLPQMAPLAFLDDQVPLVAHLEHVPGLFAGVAMLNTSADAIELPLIYPYVPLDTDHDIADTLYLLYKVHVNLLFELLRYMQLKKFFACFCNFNLILTAPVIKLYTSDLIAEWIKQCDLVLYKRMMRMLTRLQFHTYIPAEMIMQLKLVAEGFVKAMTLNLLNHKASKPLMTGKLKLAKGFTNLLHRLIKVIETGQAALRILRDDDDKNNMVTDWRRLDLAHIVRREVGCLADAVATLERVLATDVVDMLTPASAPKEILPALSHFLLELPGKFPGINPRLYVVVQQNLLTTCLREISFLSLLGFGAWWVMRCWVDEYVLWCFELGGFLADDIARAHRTPRHAPAPAPEAQMLHPVDDIGDAPVAIEDFAHGDGAGEPSGDGGADALSGNLLFGTVDLMDFSLGIDSATGGGKDDGVGGVPNDVLLNYEAKVENFFG